MIRNKKLLLYLNEIRNFASEKASPSNNKNFTPMLTFRDFHTSFHNLYRKKSDKSKSDSIKYKHFRTNVSYDVITPTIIRTHLMGLWAHFKSTFPHHNYIIVQLKISFGNGLIRSLSKMQICHVNDFEKLLTVFNSMFDREHIVESNREIQTLDGEIIFLFKPLIDESELKGSIFNLLDEKYVTDQNIKHIPLSETMPPHEIKDLKIPRHMLLRDWPSIVINEKDKSGIGLYILRDHKTNQVKSVYVFKIFLINDTQHEIEIYKDEVYLYSIIDSMIKPGNFSYFKRELAVKYKEGINVTNTFIFKDGKIVYMQEPRSAKFIPSSNKDVKQNSERVLTMDIETRTMDGVLVPICLSVFNGKKSNTYLFRNPNNWKEEMQKVLSFYFSRKYSYWKVYFHNFAKFDAVFILGVLSKFAHISPTIRDGNLIQVRATVQKGKKKYTLIFRDSYMVLPESLDDLSKSFAIKDKKSIFPILFPNKKDFNFNYYGKVPEYKFFPKAYTPKFTAEDYKKYCSKFKRWSFKEELIKYCENDTIALYQILQSFAKNIFQSEWGEHNIKFNIDIFNYPTLPSIAFAIYRANFFIENTIPRIFYTVYDDLKHAYFGGFTESYKIQGRDVNSYDVNSLYPSAMKKYDMPVGNPIKFTGNPYEIANDPFGFFFVEVSAPLDLRIPILPHRVDTGTGVRTITPVGTWKGWYFSEEILNARKFGYKFNILKGYLFERKNIFDRYVDTLYHVKCNTPSTDPMYNISKLLLNSLYGRMGMSPELDITKIVTVEESEQLIKKEQVVNIVPLDSDIIMITYKQTQSELDDENVSSEVNTSVPVAAAITAYARIEMTKYLSKYKNNIYAIDTDGIKIDCKLDPVFMDSKVLGKMKYEYTFKWAIFPAPKVYGGYLLKPYKKWKNEMVKIKGVKVPISFFNLLGIIYEDKSLIIDQQKWYRSFEEGNIIIKDEKYTLTLTDNKREIVRNSFGEAIDTLPILLEAGKVIRRLIPRLFYLQKPLFIDYIIGKYLPPFEFKEKKLPDVIYIEPALPEIIFLSGPVRPPLFDPFRAARKEYLEYRKNLKK